MLSSAMLALISFCIPVALFAVGGALTSYQRRRELDDDLANETFEQLAEQLCLTCTHGYSMESRDVEREVAGVVAGLPVHLDVGIDALSGHRDTRGSISLQHCFLPRLEVHPNQALALFDKTPSMLDIKTGDAIFDRFLELRGDDPLAVCTVVDAPAREALLKLYHIAPTARVAHNQILWTTSEVAVEQSRLNEILSAMIDAAIALRAGAHRIRDESSGLLRAGGRDPFSD